MGDPTIETVIFVIFLLVGLGLLGGAGLSGYRRYTILTMWPSAEGVVLDSELYRHRSDFIRKSGGTVLFGYTVAGANYKSCVSSPYVSRSYKVQQELGERYAPGSRHAIRYNPEDPNEIRFEVGYNIGFFLVPLVLCFIGIVLSMLGLIFMLAFRMA